MRTTITLTMILTARLLASSPSGESPEKLMAAAIYQAKVLGDPPAAIKQFRSIAARYAGKPVAAQALADLGQAQEQLGDGGRARDAYMQLVREYPGQARLAARMRQNLASTADAKFKTQGVNWVSPHLAASPPGRCCMGMAYDRAMGATLLYGGRTYTTTFGDTWAFSKAKGWTQLTPAVCPPPLAGASLAYDATTKTVVLFGGSFASNTNSNETWTWDGVTWTQQFPAVSPPARNWNATNGMVFDFQLGKVVLFGGYTDQFIIMNDTWEWDGKSKTWMQQFPANSPSPRTTTLAYDETAKQVVLFGGWTNGIAYGDTWAYDGVNWVQQQPVTSPQTRAENGLAFDPILGKVVLFGGLAGALRRLWARPVELHLAMGRTELEPGVQTSLRPQSSSGVSFTYDRTTEGMLLFGGWVTDSSFTSNTWLFKVF